MVVLVMLWMSAVSPRQETVRTDCAIWRETCGSGYQIGTILDITPIVQHLTRPVRLAAQAVSGAVAASSTTTTPSARRIAPAAPRRATPPTWASAVPGRNEKLGYCYTVPLIRGVSRHFRMWPGRRQGAATCALSCAADSASGARPDGDLTFGGLQMPFPCSHNGMTGSNCKIVG